MEDVPADTRNDAAHPAVGTRVDVMELTLRGARRDLVDGRRYARYLDIAADGLFGAMLGSAADEVIANASLRAGTEFDVASAVFAEAAGQVVGMCSGSMTNPDAGLPLTLRDVGWRAPRALAVALWTYPLLSALTRRGPGEWYLQSIAVDSQVRGGGVGSMLFADAIERARTAGATRLVLDVADDNPRARALYERLGMTRQWSSRRVPLAGQVHRMSMPI